MYYEAQVLQVYNLLSTMLKSKSMKITNIFKAIFKYNLSQTDIAFYSVYLPSYVILHIY